MSRLKNVLRPRALALVVAILLVDALTPAGAQTGQGGRGMGGGMMGGGMMNDPAHQADMQLFHFLLDNGPRITRVVTVRPDGVESVTESDDAAVVKAIQEHVSSMSARVKEARPIHQRDPLFREVFKNADKIVVQYEHDAKGRQGRRDFERPLCREAHPGARRGRDRLHRQRPRRDDEGSRGAGARQVGRLDRLSPRRPQDCKRIEE